MDQTRVMILDDEEIVCERLRSHLEKNGFEVETFTDSEKAIEALGGKRYHVLVTDLKMAGPSGLDVLHTVRDRGLPTQVIVITGYASFEAAREAEAVGAYEFITKPFGLKDITKLVKNAAKQARRSRGWEA